MQDKLRLWKDHQISKKLLKVLEDRKKNFINELIYHTHNQIDFNRLQGHITELDQILDLESLLLDELHDIN